MKYLKLAANIAQFSNTNNATHTGKTHGKKSLTTPLLVLCSAISLQSHAGGLEEVIVTASPLAKNHDDLTQPAAALSDQALREHAAGTLGETLNGLLGVSSSSFGPGVGLPVIRGQTDNRVKVMQDSISTMDASAASPDHAITAEPLLADRIEVLRGPAALRYGSGAIGGVVNIFDNRIPDEIPEGIEGGAEVRYGSANNEKAVVATVTGGMGNIAVHLDGIKRSSDDVDIPGAAAKNIDDPALTSHKTLRNTDADSHSGSVGISYVGDRGFIGVAINKTANNYGVPLEPAERDNTGAISDPEFVRIDMEQTRVDIKGKLDEPFAGFDNINFRVGHNDYEHTEMENGEPGTKFTNDAWESRIEAIHNPLGKWQGALGLQFAKRTFAAIGDEAFIPKSDIDNRGIFIMEETEAGAWHFELGARFEQQEITPEQSASLDHNSANFSAAATWRFAENQRASLNIAQSQRAPSIEELLANGPHPATGSYLLGDTQLDNETSNNIELGYHWENPIFHSSINAYYNQIDDFIYARATGGEQDGLTEYRYTQQNATFKGIEAETTAQVSDQFSIRLYGDTVRAELNNGDDVPRIPPARIGTEFRFDGEQWSTNLNVLHAFKQNNPGLNETTTDSYTRVDGNISYTVEQNSMDYVIFLKATNLLNKDIRNATSFLRDIAPEAGRSLQLGVRLNF